MANSRENKEVTRTCPRSAECVCGGCDLSCHSGLSEEKRRRIAALRNLAEVQACEESGHRLGVRLSSATLDRNWNNPGPSKACVVGILLAWLGLVCCSSSLAE